MKHFPCISVFVAILSLAFLSSMELSAKRPVFKNTKWVYVEEMFVADVGTETDTTTLEFGPGNEIVIRNAWHLPAHPAMYVNPDGSIDMIPGSSGEHSSKGTWRYRWGKLTVSLEDGSKEEFRYLEGMLVRTGGVGGAKVFHRQ
jgi:hypothetical protein